MNFLQVWFTAYLHPSRAYEALKDKPAPHWGLCGYLIRGVGTSLLYFVPSILIGRESPTPSYLTFLPTESYYTALVFLFPVVNLAIWLLCGALTHMILRFIDRPSDIDQILNITGIAWLVLGPIIVGFDWLVILTFGGINEYVWGFSHLVLDLWYLYLLTIGYKKILGLPYWLTFCLFLLSLAASVPIAMCFFRG